jgi:hypothetical protein
MDEYRYFLDRALDGMLGAISDLGDDLANEVPPLDGANSPWAITYHCTRVADYWIGHLIAGRPTNRDWASEFTSRGTVGELVDRIETLRQHLKVDLETFDPGTPLTDTPRSEYQGPSRTLTPTGVLLHVLEELAQHHGQVELSRDILRHRVGTTP